MIDRTKSWNKCVLFVSLRFMSHRPEVANLSYPNSFKLKINDYFALHKHSVSLDMEIKTMIKHIWLTSISWSKHHLLEVERLKRIYAQTIITDKVHITCLC